MFVKMYLYKYRIYIYIYTYIVIQVHYIVQENQIKGPSQFKLSYMSEYILYIYNIKLFNYLFIDIPFNNILKRLAFKFFGLKIKYIVCITFLTTE